MKTMRICILILLFLSAGSMGCGSHADDDGDYRIYYLNKESTKIVSLPYELKADGKDTSAVIDELFFMLASDSGDVEYVKPIPSDVAVLDYTLEETALTVYFNDAYGSMEKIEEALARAAIVRTMTQVKEVECLSFYVGASPLTNQSGTPVGIMTNDSFIENPGEQINSIQSATLVLYFADQEGGALVQETQDVHYSSNISMEKLVMEHLLDGPKSKQAQSAIPEGTKLINVSVLEGVCSVSLDENFLKQNYNIEEAVVIYSIVNSLSEIPTINKVQISVNGDTSGIYRDHFAMNELYERNLDYVKE